MAIDWSHLPPEVISKVCMCPMANGFSHRPDTDYWVHAKCGKPTIPVAVRECDTCGKAFVPKIYQNSNTCYIIGIECDDCNPPS